MHMKKIDRKKILWSFRPVLLVGVFLLTKQHIYPYIIPAATPEVFYEWWVYASYEDLQIPREWDTVLFFHADRCPSCVRAEKNFLASGIPTWLNIIKVDYDDNPELREKYWIRSQTSYAYVNPDGSLIHSWVGSMSIGNILENIEKVK